MNWNYAAVIAIAENRWFNNPYNTGASLRLCNNKDYIGVVNCASWDSISCSQLESYEVQKDDSDFYAFKVFKTSHDLKTINEKVVSEFISDYKKDPKEVYGVGVFSSENWKPTNEQVKKFSLWEKEYFEHIKKEEKYYQSL